MDRNPEIGGEVINMPLRSHYRLTACIWFGASSPCPNSKTPDTQDRYVKFRPLPFENKGIYVSLNPKLKYGR